MLHCAHDLGHDFAIEAERELDRGDQIESDGDVISIDTSIALDEA